MNDTISASKYSIVQHHWEMSTLPNEVYLQLRVPWSTVVAKAAKYTEAVGITDEDRLYTNIDWTVNSSAMSSCTAFFW